MTLRCLLNPWRFRCVPVRHAEDFANHLQKTGVEHSERTPGNLGAYVRRETQDEWEHFFLATYWKDLEAVKAFAGEQYQIAVAYPNDEQFQLLSDPYVFQHNVQTVSPL
ncbi:MULTISPECIES: antibiotic biosynthesis monooxygenase [Pantoea]|uniref:antibiotic biosynthesis monooxygenase family protein n=1 Tax=Pantoea TaxID=53335 RepID=UPI0023F73DB0|nr:MULTISPECIES: antibiotic biosynthesis monooxygenase [Pantoea]